MSEASLETARARDAGANRSGAKTRPRVDCVGVDKSRTLGFKWSGANLSGHPGDTVASALLANDVKVVGRSFKYHRPRGVMSAGVEEGGAIVTLGKGARRTPNCNASTEELFDGLIADGQNAWPSVGFDLGEMNNLFGRFFNAGFYYKTFFSFLPVGGRGTGHWMWFEKAIRRAAGMGTASRAPDPDTYETAHGFCDALVVGSGPAGLEAALKLAGAGMDVVLAEQDFELGGRLLAEAAMVEGSPADSWRREKLSALESAGVRILKRATVFGLYDGGVAGILERVGPQSAEGAPHQVRQRYWVMRAERTILATGGLERGVAFGDNDRPGVMTAGAAQAYRNRFGVLAGQRAIVATTNDSGYAAAADLATAGIDVTLLDARHEPGPALEGVRIRHGAAPLRAIGGKRGLTGLELALADGAGWRDGGEMLPCDLIAVSGGWTPVMNLLSHRGVKPVWDAELAAFLPGESAEPISLCGAAAGVDTADGCAASGRNAANRVLGLQEEPAPPAPAAAWPLRPIYEVRAPNKKLKSFVDPQHDVTASDVRLAHQEGYVSVEHLKRYTTLGMASDQGKNGNIIGLALMADALGREIPQVGVTTFRPPYTPVAIGAFSGRHRGAHFKPVRETPMHAWNLAQGAVMTDAGLWKRPWYFPRAGESLDKAYVREATRTREAVGLCDVTSLGKISIQGPDAAEFLNRIYVNGFAKLALGRARYGVMLRDDGLVFDDGTTWRVGEHDYFMTTTTAGAGAVMSFLEELQQTRWPDLDVAITSVSDRWAGFAVAGPLSRRVLERVVGECAFDDESFPFMGVREGEVGGAPARIARISFSGELAYEIYVESDYGEALAQALWEVAEPAGGVLYGTEALGAMRIEKGHVTHSEIDGRVSLADLGMEKMASTKKAFVGKALAKREAIADSYRPQLVGLTPETHGEVFRNGAILTDLAQQADGGRPTHGEGWITSVTYSPILDNWIGLGFVQGGLNVWRDKVIQASDPVRGKSVNVRVVSPHMADTEGVRLKPAADPELRIADDQRAPGAAARRSALGVNLSSGEPTRSFGRTALSNLEYAGMVEGDGPVWMAEGAPRTLWQIVAHSDGFASATQLISDVIGAEAPGPRRMIEGDGASGAMRVGPTTWQLYGVQANQTARLATASDDLSVLELSHGFSRFRIGGAEAATCLNRVLPIDLRSRNFPVGSVATTGLHSAPSTLVRVSEQTYDLWVMRSYARSLWDLLEETARQF